MDDPVFDKINIHFMRRNELFEHAIKKEKRLVQLIKENKWTVDAERFLDIPGPFGAHRGIFIPTLIGQGTEEQKERFLIPAKNYQIIGCYAQSELGHGSNVQGLETTAIYIPETDEFEIHSPFLTSSKTATHAIVMAQMKSNGKDYGPHPFIIQIRDLETHSPLPGITIGDIDPKFGFNFNDNGFILLDHVRIPRFNILSKYSQIEETTGRYISPPNNKSNYGIMLLVRALIVTSVRVVLARAATIAIHYSATRRQFIDKDEPKKLKNGRIVETLALDQQYKLFPVIAQSYACFFTSKAMVNLYTKYMSDGNHSLLADLYASSSGLKSLITTMAMESIEDCRRACSGGHGYSSFSDFVKFYQDCLPNTTWEGDNYVLTQQTARYLMKTFRKVTRNPEKYASQIDINPTITYILQYLNEPNQKCTAIKPLDFNNQELQLKAFRHRIGYLIANAVDQIDKQGKSWNSMLVEINRISRAHCQYLLVQNFITALQHNNSIEDESLNILHNNMSLKKVMTSVCNLFVLHTIEKDIGEFFESEYLTLSQARLLRTQLYRLLKEIRPNAVSLVDAFLIPDDLLGGKVSDDWASKEPLNGIALNVNPNSNDMILAKL